MLMEAVLPLEFKMVLEISIALFESLERFLMSIIRFITITTQKFLACLHEFFIVFLLKIMIMTLNRLMFEGIFQDISASPLYDIISGPQRSEHMEQLFRALLGNQPQVLSEHHEVCVV